MSDEAEHRQRVLPDACIEIVFATHQPTLVYGPATSWKDLTLPAGFRGAAIRLWPGAAATVLNVDAVDLTDRVVTLAELPTMGHSRGAPASAAVTMRSLLAQVASTAPWTADPVVLAAIRLLHRHPATSVAVLAQTMHISQRQLRRRFTRTVGFPLTRYRRIARMTATLGALQRPRWTWAVLADEMGFADQAHLSREIRDLTGWTPRTLIARAPLLSAADPTPDRY